MTLKVLELFGGIGACTAALKRLGIDIEIIDYVEIDKYACASYNAINGTDFKPQDITKWDKQIDVDFCLHGSPCTDFSTIGLNKGGDKGSGTHSSLMYETIRIVEKLKPKYVIWENVANLLSEKHFHNFANYINALGALGYASAYEVLNSKDFGIPQNRERVFTISVLGGRTLDLFGYDLDYKFPKPFKLGKNLKEMLDEYVEEKYNVKGKQLVQILRKDRIEKNYVYINPEIIGALTARMYKNWGGNYVTFNNKNIKKDIYRQLTPRECWRLQGRTDEKFDKAAAVCSDTQLYKQAGNSITVDVLYYLFKNLFEQYPQEEI